MIDRRALSAFTVVLGFALGPVQRCGGAEMPDFSSLDATRQRPLFAPTRRPPPARPVAEDVDDETAAVLPATPDIRVSGIIVGTDKRVAILRIGQSAPWQRLSVGGQIGGWILSSIESRQIELRHDAQRMVVSLPNAGEHR